MGWEEGEGLGVLSEDSNGELPAVALDFAWGGGGGGGVLLFTEFLVLPLNTLILQCE